MRNFLEKKVSDELIKSLLEAAQVSPSAKNRQPWKFIVYAGEWKEAFADAMQNIFAMLCYFITLLQS